MKSATSNTTNACRFAHSEIQRVAEVVAARVDEGAMAAILAAAMESAIVWQLAAKRAGLIIRHAWQIAVRD